MARGLVPGVEAVEVASCCPVRSSDSPIFRLADFPPSLLWEMDAWIEILSPWSVAGHRTTWGCAHWGVTSNNEDEEWAGLQPGGRSAVHQHNRQRLCLRWQVQITEISTMNIFISMLHFGVQRIYYSTVDAENPKKLIMFKCNKVYTSLVVIKITNNPIFT